MRWRDLLPARLAHPVVAPVAVAAASAAGLVYLYGHDPSTPGQWLPRCPFHAVTGLWCPACGGTRMMYALLHGHVAEAAGHNVVVFACLPLAAWVYAQWLRAAARGRRYPVPLGRRGVAVMLTAAVAWTVVRNLLGLV